MRNSKKMTLSYEMNMSTGEGVRFSDATETSKGLGKDRIAAKIISNMDTTSWAYAYKKSLEMASATKIKMNSAVQKLFPDFRIDDLPNIEKRNRPYCFIKKNPSNHGI